MITALTVFLTLLTIGVPIVFVIGAPRMVFLLQNTHLSLVHVAQLPLTQAQSISMLAAPLSILAGSLMNNRGVTERLVGFVTLLTGHIRGDLAQTSVVLSTLMGGISDSATVGVAMEAHFLGLDMIKGGYSEGLSANVLTFTSLITATTPPGVGLIIYSTIGGVSTGKLFSADIFTRLYTMTALVASVVVIVRVRGYKPMR